MKLEEAYKKMHENCGIKVGDTVKVLRRAEYHEMGWGTSWNVYMNNSIGNEYVVSDVSSQDFLLDVSKDCNVSYWFPFFVLEKVKDGKLDDDCRQRDDIIKFVTEECDFDCQQNNVIKIVEMLLDRIKDGTNT